jgi:hypothetical protein
LSAASPPPARRKPRSREQRRWRPLARGGDEQAIRTLMRLERDRKGAGLDIGLLIGQLGDVEEASV